MNKNLVYQVNVPNFSTHKKLKAYTYIEEMYHISEKNARDYAKKCNADYIKIDDPHAWIYASGKHVTYQKLKVYDFVEYQRCLYLDSDYIIKNNAPNLFEICGDNFCAVTDPGSIVEKLASNLGIPRERYFNAGFMYLTKEVLDKTRNFLPEYLEKEYEFQGQGILNRLFYDKGIDFNRLDSYEWNPVKKTFGLYADHYSGFKKKKWGEVKY